MTKVPQRDEIWRDKCTGKFIRIHNTNIKTGFIICLEEYNNENFCSNVYSLDDFYKLFEFVGDGKPIDVLFEVQE